jgi:GTP-binding nuclear protein Ran
MPEFKLLLVGDGGVGKKGLLRLHQNCMVDIKYVTTLGVVVDSLVFRTNRGPIQFNVWDTNGREKFGDLPDGYYRQGQCAIIMFDRRSRITTKNVPYYYRKLTRVCGDIPIVLAGNKNGSEETTVNEQISFHRKMSMKYCRVDTRSSGPLYDVEKPFLWIARALSGDDHLMFVESP